MIAVEEKKVNIIEANETVTVSVGSVISLNTSAATDFRKVVVVEAGEVIGSNKVVYVSNNKIYKASNQNLGCLNKILGVTKQAGVIGDFIEVVVFGELNGFGGLENKIYYLGVDGDIIDYIVNSGLKVEVGRGLKLDTLFVEIKNYLIR